MKLYLLATLAFFAAVNVVYTEPTIDIVVGASTIPAYAVTAAGVGVAAVLAGVHVARKVASRLHKRETLCLPFDNPEIMFMLAQHSNSQDCGRRFVCELEATNDVELNDEEKLVKSVFG